MVPEVRPAGRISGNQVRKMLRLSVKLASFMTLLGVQIGTAWTEDTVLRMLSIDTGGVQGLTPA